MFATIPAIVAIVATVLQGAQVAVQVGKDAAPFLAVLKKLFSKDAITLDDLDAIEADLALLNARIEKPIPPEED